jgi:hypothetical protein
MDLTCYNVVRFDMNKDPTLKNQRLIYEHRWRNILELLSPR